MARAGNERLVTAPPPRAPGRPREPAARAGTAPCPRRAPGTACSLPHGGRRRHSRRSSTGDRARARQPGPFASPGFAPLRFRPRPARPVPTADVLLRPDHTRERPVLRPSGCAPPAARAGTPGRRSASPRPFDAPRAAPLSGREPRPALLPAARDDRAPGPGPHPGPKPVRLLAASRVGLERPFHGSPLEILPPEAIRGHL